MSSADAIPLVVRGSAPEDIPAITTIYRDAVLHGCASFELEPPDEQEMARRREALISAGFPHIVAADGGEVLGYAYCGAYRPRPAYGATVENSVYVRTDQRGRGVGRSLLAHLISEAEARGFRQMVAVIGDPANGGSVKLHEKLGFREVGVFRSVGWKHGRWLDSMLMQRPLGPGDACPR